MYIPREFDNLIQRTFESGSKQGLILAGIVGCGKTTLVHHFLEHLRKTFPVFEFSGDDFSFRTQVATDTKYLFNFVQSQARKRAFIFVDEVQKSEAIFDAVKYAFDHADTSFLVTGSNPDYLDTIARKRLQRRADFKKLLPFSLPEILEHAGMVPKNLTETFKTLVLESQKPDIIPMNVVEERLGIVERYLNIGGLPLAHLSKDDLSLLEIKKTVERGFEPILVDTNNMTEPIMVELARVHSREFTYQNIFKRTGLRRREIVNKVIQTLKGHGYLVAKKPSFFGEPHRSYLSVYSFIDPGIVTYLTGERGVDGTLGSRIEGIIHTRLSSLVQQSALKSELGYFKPYKLDKDGDIKFLPGEIDFVIQMGSRVIPIEVKRSENIQTIDTSLISSLVKKQGSPFGIVLYGGVPIVEREKKVVFWPWWGV